MSLSIIVINYISSYPLASVIKSNTYSWCTYCQHNYVTCHHNRVLKLCRLCPLLPPFTRPLTHHFPFTLSPAYHLIHSLTHTPTTSLTHSLSLPSTPSHSRSLAHSLTPSLTHSLTHSPVYPHSLIHSRSPTYPFTQPPISFPY